MKKSLKDLGNCLLNLDTCKNLDNTLDKFINYMDDVRFDRQGLKLWIKQDPVDHGMLLAMMLYIKSGGKLSPELEKTMNGENFVEKYINDIVDLKKKFKKEKVEMIQRLKCLKYDNLQNIKFWTRYLEYTYSGQEDIENLASDLMIFVIFVSDKTKDVLVEYLNNLEMDEGFVNHIKRYSDVIRYHRGLFIEKLKNTTGILDMSKAKQIAENIVKYSHCNIDTSFNDNFEEDHRDKIKIENITSYLSGKDFQVVLPVVLSGLEWELNCSNKEIEGKNANFVNAVINQPTRVSLQPPKRQSQFVEPNQIEPIITRPSRSSSQKSRLSILESPQSSVSRLSSQEKKTSINLDKLSRELKNTEIF